MCSLEPRQAGEVARLRKRFLAILHRLAHKNQPGSLDPQHFPGSPQDGTIGQLAQIFRDTASLLVQVGKMQLSLYIALVCRQFIETRRL